MAFCAASFTLEAITSLQIYAGFFPSWGKMDRVPLVLSLKGGQGWSVCLLPIPRTCLQTGYWLDDDDINPLLKLPQPDCSFPTPSMLEQLHIENEIRK